MKKVLLAFGLLSAVTALEVRAVELYGYQTWEPMTDVPFRGPIHFDSATPADAVKIADCSDMGVVYGGYYHNYRWYGQAIVKGTQSSVDGLYEIDMVTGERTLIAKGGGAKMIDLTYDYSTDKVYGIRTGNSWLAEFDRNTGESTLKGRFAYSGEDIYMLAIAAALDGTLYGVSSTDNLFKINSQDGALTLVGPLGVDAAFDQTMAFDYQTGTLYWANNGDYTLYTINTTTGAATPIAPIGQQGVSSMASLFVPYINVAVGAPDRVTEVKGEPALTSVSLSWVYPTITAQGSSLSTLGGVIIKRDGVQVADVKATPDQIGQPGSYSDENLEPEKEYSYEIVPYNEAGEGGCDDRQLKVRVGHDLPGAVVDFTAVSGDSKALLNWLAPVAGATGGIFDPSIISGYEIKRGNNVIATLPATQLSYEDEVPFGRYSYTVSALSAFGAGLPATVENLLVKPSSWIVMGDGEVAVEAGKDYKFYDEGGPDANYYNSRKNTLVIAPQTENSYVKVKFTKFEVETYGDYLSVYDGRGTEGRLIGKFAATSLPAELTNLESSAADGCLTFMFYSDIMETAPGWEADVTASRRLSHDLEATALQVPSVAIAGTSCDYTVSIKNKGTNQAKGYSVILSDGNKTLISVAGPDIEPSTSVDFKVSYTPLEAGDMTVSAKIDYEADEDKANNVSVAHSQKVLPEGSAVVDIFADESVKADLYVMPVSFFGFESISQFIIPADALTAVKDMKLSAISFPMSDCTSSYLNVPFRVWTGETDLTDLKESIVPASQLTETFNGNADIVSGGESLDFSFATPCNYSGRNLVIMVHKLKSPTNSSGVKFRGSYGYDGAHPDCSRFASNSYEDDPAFDPETTFGYGPQNMRPDVRLMFSAKDSGVAEVILKGETAVSVNGNELSCAAPFKVFSTAGVLVASNAAGEKCVLPSGVYVVVADGKSIKVVIR